MAILFFIVDVSTCGAQRPCSIALVPEGDNICILESNSNDYSVVRACRGNTVCYSAHCAGAIRYDWTVVGGVPQISPDSTRCCVTWGDGSSGFVIVNAMLGDSSTVCTATIQVQLEDKPVIGLVTTPNYIVDVNDPMRKWIEVCEGDTITFTDNSTSSGTPITDYYWEHPFGVNVGKSCSFVAPPPGDYIVLHRVYNECGCYDEEQIQLIVHGKCPLEMSCYGTVCAFTQQTYTINSPRCSDYFWNVVGGTIISPQHHPEVTIQWDAPASGYGTISLDGSTCDCECKSRKSIKIPVISGNVAIGGPDTLCLGEAYVFSVPLWGSTEYTWSVTPEDGIALTADNNHLEVRPNEKRNYTISVTYSSPFLGCETYTVAKEITVLGPMSINVAPFAEEACIGSVDTFSTGTRDSNNWIVIRNDTVVYSSVSPLLIYTFSGIGTHTILASNAKYCHQAMVMVQVDGEPPVPTAIKGPDTICPHYTAQYSATPSNSNYYILWEWTADGITHTYSGNKVNITFGSQIFDIQAYQVDRRTGCMSDAATYHVSEFQLAPFPYTDTIKVCPGQQMVLADLRDQAADKVLYEWKVYPANALSIQGSHQKSSVVLLANHVLHLPQAVTLELKRVSCGSEHYDYATILLGTIDPPQIVPGVACQGDPSFFTVNDLTNADTASSYWFVDNDASAAVTGSYAPIIFDSSGRHVVHLHYVSKHGCSIDLTDTVNVCPQLPAMRIVHSGDSLYVNVSGSSDGLGYQWMTGDTTTSIYFTGGDYRCIVSNSCGCTYLLDNKSDEVECVMVPSAFSIRKYCYNYIGIDALNAPGLTYPLKAVISQNGHRFSVKVLGPHQRVVIPDTGAYWVTVDWTNGDSCYFGIEADTIVESLRFQIRNDCLGHLAVYAQTASRSVRLEVKVCDTVSGRLLANDSGTDSVLFVMPDTGWYRILITLDGNTNCVIDTVIHFDNPPVIDSLNVRSFMCENTAFTFSANAKGSGLTYLWNFGDSSYNFGNAIDHVYGLPSSSFRHTVGLIVTDRNGCQDTETFQVTIVDNTLNGDRLNCMHDADCPGDSVVLEVAPAIGTDNIYVWDLDNYIDSNVVSVYGEGTYMVNITSLQEHCLKQLEINIPYPNSPFASILCDSTYCQGEKAKFIGNVGSDFSYKWRIVFPSSTDSAFSPNWNYTFGAGDTGTCQLILELFDGNGCSSADTVSLYVHPAPQPPSIQFCGNSCITQGPVKLCSDNGKPLLWSNGTQGTDSYYFSDGQVCAYYIDPSTGCKSAVTAVVIPEAPDFDALLTGCYSLCDKQLPRELPLYSLSVSHNTSWDWMLNNSAISSGAVPPFPVSLPVPRFGSYQLNILDYGMGCSAQSPMLTIEHKDCKAEANSTGPGSTFPIECILDKINCEVHGCELCYSITANLCNYSGNRIKIDGIRPSRPIACSTSHSFPLTLDPGGCQMVNLSVCYDYAQPAMIKLNLFSAGEVVGTIYVDFSDWMDCVNPDTCDLKIVTAVDIRTDLSTVNQSAFFDFSLVFPTFVGNVLSVWCDQGQIIDGVFSMHAYAGLLMLDYGLLTQMVSDSVNLCFHALCCNNDTLCVNDVCLPFSYFWELCQKLDEAGNPKYASQSERQRPAAGGDFFSLVPNPATDIVHVTNARSGADAASVRKVVVFSMHGLAVLEAEASNHFDVTDLATGSYIVKVVDELGRCEYLKLVKQ